MGGTDLSDSEIISEFRRGDQKAFSRIFDDLFSRLYVFCMNLVRDDDEAEDIAIKTFSKLFERHGGFDSMGAIRAFLYKTAKNASFDHLKKARRLSARQQKFLALVEGDDNLEHVQVYMDHMAELYRAMSKLPENSRRVLEMIYLDGMKYQDVAQELQISETAVGNRRHYALKKLRELLADNPTLLIWAFEMVFINHK
jgi:RNA polymerase sigma factor (sigma-70 family)